MTILAENYLTPVFADAAQLSKSGRLDFLSNLREYADFRNIPEDAAAFRDTAVFCVNTADVPLHAFARHLLISANVLRLWTNGENLPYPRTSRAIEMIDTALHANGWVGKPPRPPIMDGSNIVQLRPSAL